MSSLNKMSFAKITSISKSTWVLRVLFATGIATSLILLLTTDFHGNPLGPARRAPFSKPPPASALSQTSILYHDQTKYLPFEDAYTFCRRRRYEVYPDRHKRRKVYDLMLVNDELDWLEIRMEQMYHQVDYFVITESELTFTGKPKPLYIRDNWDRFERFHKKMILHTVDETDADINEQDKWSREVFSRNAMTTQVLPFLTGEQQVEPKDVILVSDVDEIPRASTVIALRNCDFPERLTIRSSMYYYSFQWLNRIDNWPHPQATFWRGEETVLPNDLRWHSPGEDSLWNAGWHCSYCLSTLTEMVSKVTSFSHVEYDRPEFKNPEKILQRIRTGKDFFDRGDSHFDRIDNNLDVPDVLLAHADKYAFALDRDPVSGNFKDYVEYFETHKYPEPKEDPTSR